MKSLSLNKYFEIVNPVYVFVKITPIKSLRNYNSDKIINTVAGIYRSMTQRIVKDNKKYFFTRPVKLSYYIYMEKDKAEFYFVLPTEYKTLLRDKISDTWRGVTVEEVDSIPLLDNSVKYTMNYAREDALSLTTDKRNNVLLSSIMSTMNVLEQGDKIGVVYNFIPSEQMSWRADFDNTIKKFKDGYPIEKDKGSTAIMLKYAFKLFSTILDMVFETVAGFMGEKIKSEPLSVNNYELSKETFRKRDAKIINTQIVVLSESSNTRNAINNAVSICESFKSITGDNELKYHRFKNNKLDITNLKINGAETIKTTPLESQNFISLPAREIIEEHKIDCIETIQTEVPKELQQGYISIGVNTYRGTQTKAYLRDTYDQGNFPLVLIGEQGSGKTTYISNYVNAIKSRNEGAIVIDFIKNCELSVTIENSVDKNKLIILDMSDVTKVQGIGYNELKPKTSTPLDLYDVANRKALYIQMLVDALNIDGEPLSSSMDRYLTASSNVVFLNINATLKDVVRCLNNWEYRHQCIDNIPISLVDMLEDEITALKELDDIREGNIIGTKTQKIDGISHRINFLRKDLRLKLMFNKSCNDNINLVEAMDTGKIVLVKMPQEYFSTPYSKNVVVTYLLTKIWAAALVRGGKQENPNRFHIIIDEIFQAKTAMQLLKSQEILPQTRKFGCKFVFSCQYLKQIDIIDQTLRSAGASHMLMKGSGKANFNEFKDELYPYTLDDLEALPQYHSLNMINYEGGRAKFITALPKPKEKFIT